jgi:hypothetical protein
MAGFRVPLTEIQTKRADDRKRPPTKENDDVRANRKPGIDSRAGISESEGEDAFWRFCSVVVARDAEERK